MVIARVSRLPYCNICLNDTVLRFLTKDLAICQRCITDLKKFFVIYHLGVDPITPSKLQKNLRHAAESAYTYELEYGPYSDIQKPVAPYIPSEEELRQEADKIWDSIKKDISRSDGLVKSFFRSIFDKEAREQQILVEFKSRAEKIKSKRNIAYHEYLSSLDKFNKEKQAFIEGRLKFIESEFTSYNQSILFSKDEVGELFIRYRQRIDVKQNIPWHKKRILTKRELESTVLSIYPAQLAKLYRGYLYHLITGDGTTLPRVEDEKRKHLNLFVLDRDNRQCSICNERGDNRPLHVHHIIPLDWGGTHDPRNLVTLCYNCHNKQHKGNYVSGREQVKNRHHGGIFIAVDIETTGLSHADEVIEIAAIRFKDGNPVSKFGGLVYTDRVINDTASRITGITNEMLAGKPSMSVVFPKFLRFISDNKIIAHNAPFEKRFLIKYAKSMGLDFENEFIDTLTLARKKLPNLSNHKLMTVAGHLKIGFDVSHRAYDDALVAGKIYIKLLNTRKQKKK